MTHRKTLGEAIRTLRRAKGLTQEQLARKTKLTSGYISTVELGQETISIDNLLRIARAFNTTLAELVQNIK